MLTREQLLIAETVKSLLDLLPVISSIEKQILDQPNNIEFLANTAFLQRKCKEVLDGVSKSIDTMGAKAEEECCMQLATFEEKKYTTEYATVTPKSDFYVKFPRGPNAPGFAEFITQLPINALRAHYPTVEEIIGESISKGTGLPFGLTEINGVKFKLRVTSKKEL